MPRISSVAFKGNSAPHLLADGRHYSESAERMPVRNPATGAVIGNMSVLLPNSHAVEDLAHWAHIAQECWHWEVQEQEKEVVFRSIIKKLEEHMGPLARTMTLESGKLWKWAIAEAQEAIDTLWHYHGEISRAYTHDGFTRCQLPDKNAFSLRIPYGKILKISPWNFPLAVPMWAVCGALAGGNSIVLKPAEQTPFTMYYVACLIHEAINETISDERMFKLAGLLQIVQGPGETNGKTLLEEFDYDKATFTGSGNVGKIVASIAGGRLKPCHLELGGHAAMVVLDDFDIDLAVAEAIAANLGDSGQRCVSARVVFVQKSRYKEFLAKYLEHAQARRIGHPMDFKTEMGPLISKEQLARVDEMVCTTAEQIGKLPLLGGYPLISKEGTPRCEALNVDEDAISRGGYYYAPTVFAEVPYGVTAMDEEIFGPVIVINPLEGDTREQAFWNAVELVNASHYGLSNALLTNDRRFSSRAPGRFKTGLLYIGRGPAGAEVNKYFGGVKASGWGREGKGLDAWTQIQQVTDDFHGKARMAQSGAEAQMKAVFSAERSPLEDIKNPNAELYGIGKKKGERREKK
ncbi:MAG: aldehyde dehydrogenase family protein [bacterium]|nr:aldehyde dehydrogenase family protein [bacterium]